MRRLQIGVIGPAKDGCPEKAEILAEEIGSLLAKEGCIVVTGGTDGVMEAASRGAKKAGGLTVGTPGRERGISNRYVDIEILTPIGTGDFLFAGILTCDGFIVIPGGAGTLAELCLAYRNRKPVVIMKGFQDYDSLTGEFLDRGKEVYFPVAETAGEAVRKIMEQAKIQLRRTI